MNDSDTQGLPKQETTEQEMKPTYAPAALALGITLAFWGILTHWSMSLIGAAVIVGSIWSWMHEIHSSWSETP